MLTWLRMNCIMTLLSLEPALACLLCICVLISLYPAVCFTIDSLIGAQTYQKACVRIRCGDMKGKQQLCYTKDEQRGCI